MQHTYLDEWLLPLNPNADLGLGQCHVHITTFNIGRDRRRHLNVADCLGPFVGKLGLLRFLASLALFLLAVSVSQFSGREILLGGGSRHGGGWCGQVDMRSRESFPGMLVGLGRRELQPALFTLIGQPRLVPGTSRLFAWTFVIVFIERSILPYQPAIGRSKLLVRPVISILFLTSPRRCKQHVFF